MENNKTSYYIDESNILSKTGHSVYTCVFIEYFNKENITQKIINIEEKLKISYTYWVDMPWKLRIKFAQKVKNIDFICRLIVYKNPIIQKNTLEDFLSKIINTKDNVLKITIDGNKGEKYENKLKN